QAAEAAGEHRHAAPGALAARPDRSAVHRMTREVGHEDHHTPRAARLAECDPRTAAPRAGLTERAALCDSRATLSGRRPAARARVVGRELRTSRGGRGGDRLASWVIAAESTARG